MKTASMEEVANSEPVNRPPNEAPELPAAAHAAATSRPVELLREPYPGDPTREIILLRATFAPGDSTPPHQHPGFLVGYVLTGELEFQLEGQPLQRLTAGDRFYEPPESAHVVSRNPGTSTTQVLAFIVHDKDARVMIPLK
ncbi:MAG: cupin domain-containing protein [Chthoniobacter sp.]|uniref:cupin domain-containing protein n=1 Tax=Chthoniobacter sp. TaxID=2510640 RepID=UPI0032A47C75